MSFPNVHDAGVAIHTRGRVCSPTRLGIDSLTPVRSALAGRRPAVRDKFLSPFPKRLKSITDGAYDAMMNAIRRDELPGMYFIQYEISGRDAAPRRPRTAEPAVPTNEFTTSEVYAFTRELEKLHPDNRNIKAKIRQ